MDLTPMYQALSEDQDDFFDAHPEYVRPEVAEAAREDFNRAAGQGQGGLAFFAATAAALIYLHLGDRPKALLNRFDALQALFMSTDDPEGYDDVRGQVLELHGLATQIGDRRLAFRALVLAGDCSWFAAQSASGGELSGLEPRLVGTLQDVLAALGEIEAPPGDADQKIWVERLASLLAACTQAAMSTDWGKKQSEVEYLLRRLAAAADALPVDLAFEQEGPQKQAGVAAALERLESQYH